jgi:transcriptional regulator with XRE-family HTH domain
MAEVMDRLKAVREHAGKSPAELAGATGISIPHYYDLESGDDIYCTISLRELRQLSAALGVSSHYLFSGAGIVRNAFIDFRSLAKLVARYLDDHDMPQPVFEERVGWSLGAFPMDANAAWEWNVDCLRDICAALGVDWRDALP